MLGGGELEGALRGISPKKVSGNFARVVTTSSLLGMAVGADGFPEATKIHPNLLFAGGPRANGGRFTPIGGPEALYLASSERTASAEWEAGLKSLFPGLPLPPKTVFHARVKLVQVLDVTLPETQALLGTDPGELASEWKLLADPPTQRLGMTAYDSGRFCAIRYRSTKDTRSYCIVVFPDRLSSSETVSVLDPQQFFSQFPLGGEQRKSRTSLTTP